MVDDRNYIDLCHIHYRGHYTHPPSIVSTKNLHRNYIGIDKSHQAIKLDKSRLKD